jgi:hypothetical protein
MDVFGYFGTQHQTAFITASARFDYSKNNPIPTQKFFDLFNFIAVDTDNKYLYVYRIGANYNDFRGGIRDYLIYDYSTNKVVNDGGSDIVNTSGSTLQRPDNNSIYAGFMYFDTTLNKMIVWNGSAWVEEDGAKAGVKRRGTTSERPAAANIYVGFQYFDTTLNKMIVRNSSAWTNLDGTSLT